MPRAVQTEMSGSGVVGQGRRLLQDGGAGAVLPPWRGSSGEFYRFAKIGSTGIPSKYGYRTLSGFNASADLSGGFYEDGPYGPVKLTKSNALATSLLSWAILDLPDAFEPDQFVRAVHVLWLICVLAQSFSIV